MLYYDEHQALGDNGKPVKGDKTGEWEVFVQTTDSDVLGLKEVGRVHVGPHGTGKHGNDQAPVAAAERVARLISKRVIARRS